MFGFNGTMHSHYIASPWNENDSEGYYVTTVDNEIISFPKNVNCIEFFSKDTALKITLNDDTGIFYVPVGGRESVSNMLVTFFKVLNVAGTKIKWRALVSIENT